MKVLFFGGFIFLTVCFLGCDRQNEMMVKKEFKAYTSNTSKNIGSLVTQVNDNEFSNIGLDVFQSYGGEVTDLVVATFDYNESIQGSQSVGYANLSGSAISSSVTKYPVIHSGSNVIEFFINGNDLSEGSLVANISVNNNSISIGPIYLKIIPYSYEMKESSMPTEISLDSIKYVSYNNYPGEVEFTFSWDGGSPNTVFSSESLYINIEVAPTNTFDHDVVSMSTSVNPVNGYANLSWHPNLNYPSPAINRYYRVLASTDNVNWSVVGSLYPYYWFSLSNYHSSISGPVIEVKNYVNGYFF